MAGKEGKQDYRAAPGEPVFGRCECLPCSLVIDLPPAFVWRLVPSVWLRGRRRPGVRAWRGEGFLGVAGGE